jgi:hypothetical protein
MKTNLRAPTICLRPVPGRGKSEIKTYTRWAALVCVCVIAFAFMALPAWAQNMDTPRIQVFGGYSYTRFDSKTFGYASDSGLNGGTLMVAGNLYRGFGGLAQASVSSGSGINLRDVLFGPQFLLPHGKFLFFAHGLFGRARSTVRAGTGQLDTQNAQAFGGGIDMNYRNHFAIRLIQVDYLRTQLFQHDQNNLQFSVGVVYQWGAIRRKGHRAPSIPTP